MTTPVRNPKDRPTLSVTGDVYAMLVTGDETGGAYTVFQSIVSPGGGPPLHTHTREDENFYIVEGEVTFAIAGRTVVARAGDVVHAVKNVQHTFTNKTSRPAKMLVTAIPAGIDRMFFEIGDVLAPGATTPAPMTEAAIAKVIEACPRYGIVLAPPA